MDSRYKQEQEEDDVSSLVFCCLLGEGIYRKKGKEMTAQEQRHMMQVRIVSQEHGMRIRSCGS